MGAIFGRHDPGMGGYLPGRPEGKRRKELRANGAGTEQAVGGCLVHGWPRQDSGAVGARGLGRVQG